MKIGDRVRIKPSIHASEDLKTKIKSSGEVIGEVMDISSIGVCTVAILNGVTIDGYTYTIELENGQCVLIDIHKGDLEVVAI